MVTLRCPRCGNADPEKFLTVTSPYMMHVKELRGQILDGFRCAVCKTLLKPNGEVSDR